MMSIDFSNVNWWAQIPFFIVLCYLISRLVQGGKRGFVKELCSLISFCAASIAIILIAFGIQNFFKKDVVLVVVAIVLILLLGIVYKLLDVFLISLKLISKLPVIKVIDKLLGLAIGIAETVLFVWAIYCIIMIINPGAFGNWIMNCVHNNRYMAVLYDNNYMYKYIAIWYQKLSSIDILSKMGFVK